MNDINWATIEVDYKAMSVVATPFYKAEDCHLTVSVLDAVREGITQMDDCREEAKTIKLFSVLDDLMEITHTTYEEMYDLELMQTAEVDGDIDTLNRVLRSARRYAKGRTQKLERTLKDKNKADDVKLGVMYSASLFRTPVTEKGRLDIRALRSTSMDVTTEFLSFGGYDLGAPAYMEEYAVLHLHSYRTDKVVDPVTKAKTEVTTEIDLGLWFDLNPVAVRMNTAVRRPSKDVRRDLIEIAEAQESSLQKSWKSNIMESHSGWCRSAQLHVQVDLGEYDIRVDRKTAEYIRIGMGLKSIEDVEGIEVDLTGYPMVNSSCRPRVTVRVCKEEGVQQSISVSPALVTRMGRDNDGDVCALHNAYVSMNGAVRDLLHSLTHSERR